MEMYFYWGTDVIFLFKSWRTNGNMFSYLMCLLGSFLAAILVEFLTTRKFENKLVQAALYAVQLLLSYLLMLVLMTFNSGLFIVIMLGYTTGYALFGFSDVKFTRKGDNAASQLIGYGANPTTYY